MVAKIPQNIVNEIVDLYFADPIPFAKFKMKYNIKYHQISICSWVRTDERYQLLTARHHHMYSNSFKFKVLEMKANGYGYRRICKMMNITNGGVIQHWCKQLFGIKGGNIFMARPKKIAKLMARDRNKLTQDELQVVIEQLEFELACKEAENTLLKKFEGSAKKSKTGISNESKTIVITSLSPKYKIVRLCQYYEIPTSTYYENKARIEKDSKAGEISKNEQKIIDFFKEDKRRVNKNGYRKVYKYFEDLDEIIPENQVRSIMKKHDLNMIQRKRMKKHNSYLDDGNPPVTNWLYDKETKQHFFTPCRQWEILGTDVTEFHINNFKVYLSPIIDFYDMMPVAWKISTHPDTALMLGSLKSAIKKAPNSARFVVHSDQGSVYRGNTWKTYCENHHILQSMSRKGTSGDNAPVEGFFGILKQEFFNCSDFSQMSCEEFIKELDKYMHWYCEERIFTKNADKVAERRLTFGRAA